MTKKTENQDSESKTETKKLRRKNTELRQRIEELKNYANDLMHGHVHIHYGPIDIDYDLPDEVRRSHHWINRIYIWVAASIIGLFAIGFAQLCDLATHFFKSVHSQSSWLPFIIMPFGLTLIRWLTDHFAPGAEGSGIPQVVASLKETEIKKVRFLLSTRIAVGKALGTIGGLLCGASIGREGPTVQLGAIVLRKFALKLKAPILYTRKSLILAGGAAGVSAAFNTPIAGIIFAIEELGKSFYEKETSVLMMAIVVAGLTALSISGDYFYFGHTQTEMPGFDKLYAIPVGIVCGLLGSFFSIAIFRGSRWIRIVGRKSKTRVYQITFLIGLVLAGIGYLTAGATFGTGYEEAKAILENSGKDFVFDPKFVLAKFSATVLSFLTGIPGGIFAPTLTIGAGLGGWLADVFNTEFYQAFILLGMAGFFSGVVRAPITSVLIISEMTHNHTLLFPLLLASLSAHGASKIISRDSLYENLARRYSRMIERNFPSTDETKKKT